MVVLKIDLIVVGKLKESYLREACGEYVKRLAAFCKLTITEIAESRLPQNPSPAEISQGIQKEGDAILGKIPQQACLFTLCIEGEEVSSPELAQRIQAAQNRGDGTIALVIGGSFGLDERVKAQSSLRLSMSRMTFPHQLARVMALEQLYRALGINGNSKYHK